MIDKILCLLGKCRRCAIHSTEDGIGGRCVSCGRIHGWMTRHELSLAADATARGGK